MVREMKMSSRGVSRRQAFRLLVAVALTLLLAPAVSLAQMSPPETIVYEFLNRSIGKSTGVAVLKPEEIPGGVEFTHVVKVRGGPEKAPTMALILRETMRQCEPIDPFADPATQPVISAQPCVPYPGTDQVLIQVINQDGTPAVPFEVTDTDLNKALGTVRQRLNQLFNQNALWSRAYVQETSKTNPTEPIVSGHFVGVFCLFQRGLVQIPINDPREWSSRASFLPQDIFGLFMKDVIDTPAGVINLFRSTARQ